MYANNLSFKSWIVFDTQIFAFFPNIYTKCFQHMEETWLEIVDDDDEDEEQAVPNSISETEKTANEKGSPQLDSGFRDFQLKPELLKAVEECGFQQPLEVQHKCIPHALKGKDILCQAKSGMGKTTAYILATLQQLDPVDDQVSVVVVCPTRELALLVCEEYQRFTQFMPGIKVSAFVGKRSVENDKEVLKLNCPHIVVGSPGRVLSLVRSKELNMKHTKHLVLDECEKMMEALDMRGEVLDIYRSVPKGQVMMFGSSVSRVIRPTFKKILRNPIEVYMDVAPRLTLPNVQQYYVRLTDIEKDSKLLELLNVQVFNQVVIFVGTVPRCNALAQWLEERKFSVTSIHRVLTKKIWQPNFQLFQESQKRILVTTNFFYRRLDTNIKKVNLVINYDMPEETDSYLRRVACVQHSETTGFVVTFVVDKADAQTLFEIQDCFSEKVYGLPEEFDIFSYAEER
ncbi:hypothetical protein JTE90_028396 [Oedothorax gibbosus]|uniref:RNA helicase n=1 Tax=Oedothorax gibbosus TaxID=931172 RepID=A0AAV6VGZ8_9ARAC|nr:hypothetical protein JTE90_028396 [Oedothorax gibbosus]